MHCASCEVLIERKFKQVPGVEHVSANHAAKRVIVHYSERPDLAALQQTIGADGYRISSADGQSVDLGAATVTRRGAEYLQIGAIFLIITALYLVLQQLNLIPKNFGLAENMGYGLVFGVGLVASVSTCMAVVGGLALSMSANFAKEGSKARPQALFHLGRLVSFFISDNAFNKSSMPFLLTIVPEKIKTIKPTWRNCSES